MCFMFLFSLSFQYINLLSPLFVCHFTTTTTTSDCIINKVISCTCFNFRLLGLKLLETRRINYFGLELLIGWYNMRSDKRFMKTLCRLHVKDKKNKLILVMKENQEKKFETFFKLKLWKNFINFCSSFEKITVFLNSN